MLPTFSFRCAACKARLRAPINLIGRWRACPNCGQRLVVPAKPVQDLGPRLVFEDRFFGSAPLFQ
jgi:DNA-directed RNA polymerase subunit RPC12/RpoP